jgi:hypothetical protein
MVLSQANVRRIRAGVSIEELAEDIARRTLLQSLTVRPILDDEGAETGMFEVPAGGRRFRGALLFKQKRLAPQRPDLLRTEGPPEEDSLAENIQRAPLHPLEFPRVSDAAREKEIRGRHRCGVLCLGRGGAPAAVPHFRLAKLLDVSRKRSAFRRMRSVVSAPISC